MLADHTCCEDPRNIFPYLSEEWQRPTGAQENLFKLDISRIHKIFIERRAGSTIGFVTLALFHALNGKYVGLFGRIGIIDAVCRFLITGTGSGTEPIRTKANFNAWSTTNLKLRGYSHTPGCIIIQFGSGGVLHVVQSVAGDSGDNLQLKSKNQNYDIKLIDGVPSVYPFTCGIILNHNF
jgi:hypothetical protein